MRLIDADALLEKLGESLRAVKGGTKWMMGTQQGLENAIVMVKEAPTVDAEIVRHGEWVNGMQCSKCKQVDTTKPNYCPNCGARMDGGKKDAAD